MSSPSPSQSAPIILSQTPTVSPSPVASPVASPSASAPPTVPEGGVPIGVIGMGGMALLLIGGAVYGKLQIDKVNKQLRMETFRTRELKKRLDTALQLVRKMETNPDLVHSREFNLDYLRMRMEEETFHFAIVNQIKMKIKMLVSLALRPTQKTAGATSQGNAGNSRRVDHTFDVEYETNDNGKRVKRVLFRIQISLTKLPTQPTSKTIEEIIKCLEHYLSSDDMADRWQPTLQGRIATISWDQKAKPTPLLVMNQSQEGMNNVTMRSRRKTVTAAKRIRPDKETEAAIAASSKGKTTQAKASRSRAQTSTTGATQGRRSGTTQARRTTQARQGATSAKKSQGKSSNTKIRRIR